MSLANNNLLSFEYRKYYSTKNFFCIPTLGQIKEGYSLIFPNHAIINYASLDQMYFDELSSLVDKIFLITKELYTDEPTIFEHGAMKCNTDVSCGTNLAHLHIIPFDFNQIKQNLDKKCKLLFIKNDLPTLLNSLNKLNKPYMFIGTPKIGYYVYDYPEKKESQFIRKTIWDLVKPNFSWDWKLSPTYDIAMKTYANFKKYIDNTKISHIR